MIEKYADILRALVDDQLYAGGTIANLAQELGCAGAYQQRFHMRICLNHYAHAHFPKNGDGLIVSNGQVGTPGWFGWRWRHALLPPGEVQP